MNPRVAVNLLWCQPGRVGGSEQYLARQLAGLALTGDVGFDLDIYAPHGYVAAHPELSAWCTHETASNGSNRAARIVRESTWLARRTRGVAVSHHGGGTVPFRTNGRTLLTVHDVQYLTYPQYFSRARLAYLSYMMPRSLRRADAVAVPSAYVRETLVNRFGLDPATVHVVVHGIESVDTSSLDVSAARNRFGVAGFPYFIYPAITHPHKNHSFLVDMLSGPWRASGVHLLFIGGEGRGHAALLARIASSGVADRVHFTGHVGPADRDALVAGADAVVFPSEYEGFGAPVAEAMALGVPVVASDRASLPGVVGDGGIVLPLETDAWATVPERIVADRGVLVSAGHERAKSFTLAASGRDLRDAYERLVR
ncbi:MAG: glycosyltransferase family 4 protein [Acidobacteria bacterium]|nr:glycosyltransferase family 4 protein [Acidobacteriota bacterium]